MSPQLRSRTIVVFAIVATLYSFAGASAVRAADDASGLLSGFSGPSRGFIENRGQWNDDVLFGIQGGGGAVWFAHGAVVIDRLLVPPPLPPAFRASPVFATNGDANAEPRGVVIRQRFRNANLAAVVEGADPLPTRYSYFRGSDASQWRSDVRGYASLTYRGLYPGIDLAYRIEGDRLKYDVVVAPGANPGAFEIEYEGAQSIRVAASGALHIVTEAGEFVEDAPRIYQDGPRGRVEVAGRYRTLGVASAGYAIGAYDPRLPLVIDPNLRWSTFLGGSQSDYGAAVSLDANDKALVVGSTLSQSFPTTIGVYDRVFNGDYDVFISKISSEGRMLAFSTFFGAGRADFAGDVAIGDGDRIILTGVTSSDSFPTTAGAYDRTYNGGGTDAFVAMFSTQAETLIYSTFLGGSSDDMASGVTVAGINQAIVGGTTVSDNFPTTPSGYDRSYNGGIDGFVTRVNAAGSALVHSTFFGGTGDDQLNAIALSAAGKVVAVGSTNSTDLPVSAGAYDSTLTGELDVFAATFVASNGAFESATYVGGTLPDYGNAVAVTDAGDVVIAGETESDDFPVTPDSYDQEFNVFSDACILKLDESLGTLEFSTFLGGRQFEGAFGVDLDGDSRVVVTGYTASGDFPVSEAFFGQTNNRGLSDAFVSQLSPDGALLVYSTYLGGTGTDFAFAVDVGVVQRTHVTGYTSSADFPTTDTAYDTTYNGGSIDAFVTRLTLFGVEPPDKRSGGEAAASSAEPAVRVLSPVRSTIVLDLSLSEPTDLRLELFDVQGRSVLEKTMAEVPAGPSRITIEPSTGRSLAPGVYLLRVARGAAVESHRVVVVR